MSLSLERGVPRPRPAGAAAVAPTTGGARQPWICAEVLLLFAICTADMLSSAWLFHHGLAIEANPLLRGPAEAGAAPFIGIKTLTFVPALFAGEWYRRVRPQFARGLLRFVLLTYVAIYALAVGSQLLQ